MTLILPAVSSPDYAAALRALLEDKDQRNMIAALYSGDEGIRGAIMTTAFAARLNGWSSQRVTDEYQQADAALSVVRDEMRAMQADLQKGGDLSGPFDKVGPKPRAANASAGTPKERKKPKKKGRGGSSTKRPPDA